MKKQKNVATSTVYVECGCCEHYHRASYHGDCRNDSERFTADDLPSGAEIVTLEDQVDNENNPKGLNTLTDLEPEPPTVCVLRRWRKGHGNGGIIALFPGDHTTNSGCRYYEHNGQHGAADYGLVITKTRPVDLADPDAVDLIAELKGIGYNLQLRRRYTKRS